MDEQKETKEIKKEEPTTDKEEGNKQETAGLVDRAHENAERVEKLIERQKLENDRAEAIEAKQKLARKDKGGNNKETNT